MSPPPLRIAHISDLHFASFPLNPLAYCNKRITGATNLLLFRKKRLSVEQIEAILPILRLEKVQAIAITGDLSCTSFKKEFSKAKRLINKIKDLHIPFLLVPGNHDCYLPKHASEKPFYRFFPEPTPSPLPPFSLKRDGIAFGKLSPTWWYIALDTTLPTPFFHATGLFSAQLEKNLRSVLSEHIPKNAPALLLCHYPLFSTANDQKKKLERLVFLQKLLQEFPQVKLYLHGHNHTHKIINKQSKGYPLSMDAGCCAHRKTGSWNLLDLYPEKVELTSFHWDNEDFFEGKRWMRSSQLCFDFNQSDPSPELDPSQNPA